MCEFAVDPGLSDLDLRNRVGRNLEGGIRARMTKSARLPTEMLPSSASRPSARAPLRV